MNAPQCYVTRTLPVLLICVPFRSHFCARFMSSAAQVRQLLRHFCYAGSLPTILISFHTSVQSWYEAAAVFITHLSLLPFIRNKFHCFLLIEVTVKLVVFNYAPVLLHAFLAWAPGGCKRWALWNAALQASKKPLMPTGPRIRPDDVEKQNTSCLERNRTPHSAARRVCSLFNIMA